MIRIRPQTIPAFFYCLINMISRSNEFSFQIPIDQLINFQIPTYQLSNICYKIQEFLWNSSKFYLSNWLPLKNVKTFITAVTLFDYEWKFIIKQRKKQQTDSHFMRMGSDNNDNNLYGNSWMSFTYVILVECFFYLQTEFFFRNLIKSNRNQVVFTIFRSIRNQTGPCLN